jgi:hypothetical protein
MPVYQITAADLAKIRQCEPYGFLADNARVDHGAHCTITLSRRSRDLLHKQFGIETTFVHDVHHVLPAPAAAAAPANGSPESSPPG